MGIYVAVPDGPGPFPGVVVNQGLGSVEEAIQTLTRRVSETGVVAVAPLYYHRQKDNILEEVKHMPPGTPERSVRLREKMLQLRDDEVIADGQAAADHLCSMPNVDPERIGVMGFCLGGHITYLLTTALDAFKVSVPFYPAGLWQAWSDGPSPFERSAEINCPLMGLFGADDENPSPEQVAELDAQLTRLGKEHEFHTYPDAGHDFQNFRSSNYRERAAKDSWPVAMGFLRKHLAY